MSQLDSFSDYVSLGNNCEVAFQFRRVLQGDSSSFFSWNVTSLSALSSLLQSRFSGILDWSQIDCRSDAELIDDPSHNYKFHSPFRSIQDKSDEIIHAAQVEYKHKVDHLLTKLYKQGEESSRVLYIYKHDGLETGEELRGMLANIVTALTDIAGYGNFSFVVVQHEDRREPDWGDNVVKNRYLKRLAPWSDATDGHVFSWDAIFREFPYSTGLSLANY